MTSTWIKYTEGFFQLPTGHIINKPFQVWTPTHQEVAQVRINNTEEAKER